MHFRLLGAVEGDVAGRPVQLGWRQERCLLAVLLLEAGRCLSYERLAELLWEGDPPADARRAVQVPVSRLRARLTTAGAAERDVHLVTRGAGYVLEIPPERVDVHRFRSLVDDARAAGELNRSVASLRAALSLWRGPALADVAGDWLRQRVAAPLEEQRTAAHEDLMDFELAAGRHHEVVAELTGLVAEHGLRERLRGQLMIALHRTGRRVEALETYQDLRHRLRDTFGLEPGARLQQLHRKVLQADGALDIGGDPPGQLSVTGPNVPDAAADTPPGDVPSSPRQLPTDVAGFTGRTEQLKALDTLVPDPLADAGAVALSVIAGTAGVGKTALAVHWAHRVADRFPDGQLYVNLRGFDPTGSAMQPIEVLRGFVAALGVAAQRIPVAEQELAGLYRSQLAGRRVLVVLDNASDAAQVRPLLPGAPGCLVLVTSRDQLSGLVATESAHPLTLEILPVEEARQLLARRLGHDRVAAEPAAADEILTRCARLPLALAIAAARGAIRPELRLAALAEDLREARTGLDAFGGPDPSTDVRAVLSCSYRALSDRAALLFRQLGLHPGPDIAVPAVASLAGLPVGSVRPLLAELTEANLIGEHTRGRYAFHDLLRAYAVELAHGADADADRRAATHRLVDHYLHTAHAASWQVSQTRDPIDMPPAPPDVTVDAPADPRLALAWFDAELPVLHAVVDKAGAIGLDAHTIKLAWTLRIYLQRRGHWDVWVCTQQAALEAARRMRDPVAEADAVRGIGEAQAVLGRHDDALRHLRQAIDLYVDRGDDAGRANVHLTLGSVLVESQGHPREALHELHHALALFRTTGIRNGEAASLNDIGWCYILLGEYELALTHCGQALALFEQTDNRNGQAHAWDSLGQAHHHLGQPREASTCHQRALALFRELGARYDEATILTHIGDSHGAEGRADAARQTWREAVDLFDQLGHPDAEGVRSKLAGLARDSVAAMT